MKIQQVECTFYSLQLGDPYTIAYDSYDRADHIFIRLDTGKLTGWGCLAPDPMVTGEVPENMLPVIRDRLPALLIGADPLRRAKIMDGVKRAFPGYFSLWAAVDMALWDILGKHCGLPVWKILGGYHSSMETSITVGIHSEAETLERAKHHLVSGFRILKIKGGLDVNDDISRLIALRSAVGKDVRLRFDANQGYHTEEALEFVRAVSGLQIELLEQPTRKGEPEHLGRVKSGSAVPVMADESLLSLMDAFRLAQKGLVDLLNIKLMKVGGISEAMQVDSVARSAHIGVMVGCMDESALGISAALQFALSRKNIRFADLDGHLDLIEDPAADIISLKNGRLYPPEKPGLGWGGPAN